MVSEPEWLPNAERIALKEILYVTILVVQMRRVAGRLKCTSARQDQEDCTNRMRHVI